MTIYGIPGLGADQRVFEGLQLPIKPIVWVTPDQKDSIHSYAQKLVPQIATDQPFIIIGVSFGGMIATELSKLLKPKLTILISSASSADELPVTIKLVDPLINWIPESLLVKHNRFLNWFFGVHTEDGRKMLKQIIADTDVHFLKWALKAMGKWSSKEFTDNLVRIHGTADRLIPMKSDLIDYAVKDAGHFMIVEQASHINQLLTKEIKRVSTLKNRHPE